jgi:hypothetical protein
MPPADPPATPRGTLISRREILQTAALLAMAGPGCAPLTNNVRLAMVASAGLDTPGLAHVLRALIRSVLAYDHPDFASGTQHAVSERLLDYFPIDREPQLKPLTTALAIFDRIDLFPALPPPMRAAERKLIAAEGLLGSAADAALASREAADLRAYEAVRPPQTPAHFSAADLAAARAYLALWGHSAFLMRRRIYRAVRSMVLVAAYSLPSHWSLIGYDGPLVPPSGIRGS